MFLRTATSFGVLLAASAAHAACTLPADVTNRIGLAQSFTYAYTPSQYNSTNLVARDFYWNNGGDSASNPPILNASKYFSSAYMTISRMAMYTELPLANNPSHIGYPFWQLVYDHPDWIIYKADKTTPPDDFGDPYTVVDITNSAVQTWKENNEVTPSLTAGFQGVSVDNATPDNTFGYKGAWKTSPASTTTSGGVVGGATSIPLTSSSGFADGQQVVIQNAGYFRTQTISPASVGATNIVVDDVTGLSNGATVTIPGKGAGAGNYTGTIVSFTQQSGIPAGTIVVTPAIGTAITATVTATIQLPGVYVGTEVGAPSAGSITVTPAISSSVGGGAVVKTAQWNSMYSGDTVDPQFATDRADWLTILKPYVNGQNGCLTANVTYSTAALAGSTNIANAVDIAYDEDGINGNTIPSACQIFQGSGTDSQWVDKLNYIQNLSTPGYVLENSMCPLGTINRQVVEAAIGSYMLIQGPHTYLTWFFATNSDTGGLSSFVDGQVGGQWPDFWWEHGAPLENMQSDGLVYWRHFANGMALCNPSSASRSFNFGASQYHSFDNLSYPPYPADSTTVLVPGPGCLVLKNGPAAWGGVHYIAKSP